MHDYWHKQTLAKPLFPDLLWSRPENRAHAGRLLIIGGNIHSFAAAGEAYNQAMKAGIGRARVLLPDSLQKTVGRVLEAGEYAPSTPVGSFGQRALAEFLALSQSSDGVLLAGDFGRNSETAIVLEKFVNKYEGQLTITKDAVDYFITASGHIVNRPDTTLVLSFAQLQKLATNCGFTKAFTFDMDFLRLIELLHEFTTEHQIAIATQHLDNIFVATHGAVCSTKLDETPKTWRIKTAAHVAVWWLQNPQKPFESLTTAVHEIYSTSTR